MDRAEHLAWAKDRALAYLDTDQPELGLASLYADLGKHPDLAGHPTIMHPPLYRRRALNPRKAAP